MCVIILAIGQSRIDAETIERATAWNDDGIGIAWRHKGAVRWRKGLTNAQALRLCNVLPRPYAFHARMATVGGTCAALTHPFPVQPDPNIATDGEAESVLFHNGHVSDWRLIATASGADLADGQWSDSRAIAHAVAMSGPALLDELRGSNRFLLFGTKGGRMFGSWRRVGGLFFSSEIPTRGMLEMRRQYETLRERMGPQPSTLVPVSRLNTETGAWETTYVERATPEQGTDVYEANPEWDMMRDRMGGE